MNEDEVVTAADMSLRDYFAGQALVGLLSQPTRSNDPMVTRKPARRLADDSYAIADEMLVVRKGA